MEKLTKPNVTQNGSELTREQLFIKHGLKVKKVEKTDSFIMVSNNPAPNTKKPNKKKKEAKMEE